MKKLIITNQYLKLKLKNLKKIKKIKMKWLKLLKFKKKNLKGRVKYLVSN